MASLENTYQWKGRIDDKSDIEAMRIHQCIKNCSLEDLKSLKTENAYGIIGFCCDEGVRRNKGRIGAKKGPDAIRAQLASLAYPSSMPRLYDFGNISCDDDLEDAQELLSSVVEKIALKGIIPLVLGGGHETSFGHYCGLEAAFTQKQIGILNIDAHFDLRPLSEGASSGTPFLQINKLLKAKSKNFSYMCLGIQKASNTQSLFKTAEQLHVDWMSAEQMRQVGPTPVMSYAKEFSDAQDGLYLTICLDAFSSSLAPGVSAPSPFGLEAHWIERILFALKQNNKIVAVDVVELNPDLDSDSRTAKFAAHCIHKVIDS